MTMSPFIAGLIGFAIGCIVTGTFFLQGHK